MSEDFPKTSKEEKPSPRCLYLFKETSSKNFLLEVFAIQMTQEGKGSAEENQSFQYEIEFTMKASLSSKKYQFF